MYRTLGGFQFLMNGSLYDYCFKESIECMLEFCDEVSVLVVETNDGTADIVRELKRANPKLIVNYLPEMAYNLMKGYGKYKLSIFQNLAASYLTTDYQFLLQSDEILHEKCYEKVRQLKNIGTSGFMCSRINLWGSPYTQLNVPQERKPCSTEVIRFTEKGFSSVDDGENINCFVDDSYVNDIRIYHMGFVRHPEIMKNKAINMQRNVFEMENHDVKLDNCEKFEPTRWFSGSDLIPIQEPLPKIIQQWAKERYIKKASL